MGVFYRKARTLNAQKKFNAQTIFVSNHPSAFIDPLVVGNFQMPVIYFVTRGDIFTKWLQPVTWAAQMVPIFRTAEDGADSHEKNKDSFAYLKKVLLRKKSLVLFGEGYTDDVFIRSLKPIKKGPARIAFDAMSSSNWELDIKVQAAGINYEHPKYFRGNVVVSYGDCINLKDYKDLYEESSSRAITQLTRDVQKSLQEQITYVEKKNLAPFVEQIMILTRKGMNFFHSDKHIPLAKRYYYSKNLAQIVNKEFAEETPSKKWIDLKQSIESYFEQGAKMNIDENWVASFNKTKNKALFPRVLKLIVGIPIIFLGLIHMFIPYFVIKKFVENTFKRDVFWSGVKMLLISFLAALINIPFIFIIPDYFEISYWFGAAYYLIIPALSGTIAYHYFKLLNDTIRIKNASKQDLIDLSQERNELLSTIKSLGLDSLD